MIGVSLSHCMPRFWRGSLLGYFRDNGSLKICKIHRPQGTWDDHCREDNACVYIYMYIYRGLYMHTHMSVSPPNRRLA